MGAEHHRREVLAAFAHADDVADRVDGHGEAELAHPAHQEVAAGAVVVAQREAAIAAAGQGADAVEAVEPAEQALAIDPRRHAVLVLPDEATTQRASLDARRRRRRVRRRMPAPRLTGNRRNDWARLLAAQCLASACTFSALGSKRTKTIAAVHKLPMPSEVLGEDHLAFGARAFDGSRISRRTRPRLRRL
jgi:hypothetical protein